MKTLVLLLAGGFKAGKLATTGLSMLASLAIYATIWGWRYAAGFVICLLIHEIGHVIAARQRGLEVGAPAFIPFMGAFISLRHAPPDVETEAHVAIGGPLLGSVAAFGFWFAGDWWNDRLLLAISYSGFVLNLFNLLPISPLDGGRISAVLGPRIWLLGVPILLALFLYTPSPMLLVVALLAAPRVWSALRHDPGTPESQSYYTIERSKKVEYTAMYLILAVSLALMSYEVHERLSASAH